MSTSNHTKRSPEFRLRLAAIVTRLNSLIVACDEQRPELGEFLQEVRILLLDHTTDSPCVVKAQEDEPIFTLRGKDLCSPAAVREWLMRAKKNNLHGDKLADAEECREQMLDYFMGLKKQGEKKEVVH